MNPWLDRGGKPFVNAGEVGEWLREKCGGQKKRNRVEELRRQALQQIVEDSEALGLYEQQADEADRAIAEGEE